MKQSLIVEQGLTVAVLYAMFEKDKKETTKQYNILSITQLINTWYGMGDAQCNLPEVEMKKSSFLLVFSYTFYSID